ALNFLVGNEGPLCANEFGRTRWKIKHVAFTQQFVGPHSIEDGARIHFGSDLKGDAGGDVGFDDAGDDIDAWTLGGPNAMDASGTSHLRDASDGHFDICRSH